MNEGLTRKEWEEKLGQIAGNLQQATHLTLMGSAPNILGGQPSRSSIDLHVWKPTSRFDRQDLQNAVEKAGLIFNPKGEIEPNIPYLQIVEPGICQLGEFEPQEIERSGNLRIEKPPVQCLIAAKLIRAQDKDLEDISWLLANHQTKPGDVRKIIQTFPEPQRQTALENLVYLAALAPKIHRRKPLPTTLEDLPLP